jgi:hypothetical protein
MCHVGLSNEPFKCVQTPIVASNHQSDKQQSKLQVCCVHHDIKAVPSSSSRDDKKKTSFDCVSCKQHGSKG